MKQVQTAQFYRDRAQEMRRRAVALATDTRYQLVFMHFPIPHLLAFWNRRANRYSTDDRASWDARPLSDDRNAGGEVGRFLLVGRGVSANPHPRCTACRYASRASGTRSEMSLTPSPWMHENSPTAESRRSPLDRTSRMSPCSRT